MPAPSEVIVVGAGPVGLATALQLGRAGVSVELLERRAEPSTLPRAHVVNGRTMELFRDWGVAGGVRDDGLPLDMATAFGWVTRMRDDAFAQLDYVDAATAARYSPETLCSCPQDRVESRLRTAVDALPGVTVRFDHEVVGYRSTGEGAELDVREPGGTTSTRSARFVVAADGAGGPLRRLAGVGEDVSLPISRWLSIYFHADLTPYTRTRPYILWFVHHVATQGIVIALDGARRWVYSVALPPGATADEMGDDRCRELVRTMVGAPDLEVDIRARRAWSMDMAVVDRFREGPLFLAGDAAHRFPPTGGFGMNSGLQDSHNLAWKLALVLRGRAGDALLDTYDAERRPVAVANARQSVLNADRQATNAAALNSPEVLALLAQPEGADLRAQVAAGVAELKEEFHSLGQQFGHVYAGAGVVDDGSPARESTIMEYRVTARPGARAPHARLRPAGAPGGPALSTIELLTGGWTVLVAGGGEPGLRWREPVARAGEEFDLALRCAVVDSGAPGDGSDFVDDEEPGQWRALYELDPGGAVLVRPDGHVLARWATAPADPWDELHGALGTVLDVPARLPSALVQ